MAMETLAGKVRQWVGLRGKESDTYHLTIPNTHPPFTSKEWQGLLDTITSDCPPEDNIYAIHYTNPTGVWVENTNVPPARVHHLSVGNLESPGSIIGFIAITNTEKQTVGVLSTSEEHAVDKSSPVQLVSIVEDDVLLESNTIPCATIKQYSLLAAMLLGSLDTIKVDKVYHDG